jgi:hypothetical protein
MIEVTTFRVNDAVSSEEFRIADERVQTEFFYLQAGLTRRTTARSDDGSYLVLTQWDEPDQADRAAEAALLAPSAIAVVALIEPETLQIQRFSNL